MPINPKGIDVAPADVQGVCRRCTNACCNCAGCVARKGGQRDMCSRCYEAAKEAMVP